MRRWSVSSFALFASVTALSGIATAQTRTFFAGGGIIADVDRTNSRLTEHVAPSGTLVLGMDIGPHTGIRFVFDTPRGTHEVHEGVYTRPPFNLAHRERLTRTRRSLTCGIVGDVHGQLARRLRFAFTYGLLEVTHDSETIITREELRPDGSSSPLPELRDSGDHDWTGFAFGIETPILAGRRTELIPEVRVIWFPLSDSPSPYIIRSGVGLRWRF